MTTPDSQAHLLVKLLKSSISTAEKAAILPKFGQIFSFAQLAKPGDDQNWEAFRDAEVLDSLLLLVSNIDANPVRPLPLRPELPAFTGASIHRA